MFTPTAGRSLTAVLFCGALALSPLSAQDSAPAEGESSPAIMANDPQTPGEFLDAALLMLRVNRPDLAKGYLQQLVDQNVDDETLLQQQREQGTAVFLRLSQMPELQPAGAQLLSQLRAAADRRKGDLAFIDGLINQLEGTPRERSAALLELQQFGADAVPPLLERLQEPGQDTKRDLLRQTLTQLGPAVAPPLVAALDSPDETIQTTACEVLGRVGSEEDVVSLLPLMLSPEASPRVQSAARDAMARIRFGTTDGAHRLVNSGAAARLRREAESRFCGVCQRPDHPDGQIDVWSWDSALGNVVKTRTSPAAANAHSAQRLAREALLLSPSRENQALFLATSLAEDAQRAGWEHPWPDGPGSAYELALSSGPDLCESALQLSLEHNNPGAAIGCLKALGRTAQRSHLLPRDGRRSALITALDHPNERVQFAAASAILQIDPNEPFSSGHRVVEILTQALSGDAAPQSVVIDPNTQRANDTARILQQLGYESRIATTGRDGFRVAAERTRIDLAVLHLNTIRWDLTQTVANFRADARTASVPLAFVGPDECEASVHRLVERTPASTYVVMGGDATNWAGQLDPLLGSTCTPPLTPQQRLNRGAAAAYWLRDIAERSRTNVFPLGSAEDELSRAINDPELAEDALVAMTAIPFPSVQRRMLEVIANGVVEERTRETAARQLVEHARRFGTLLTEAEREQLANAASQATSPGLQTALSAAAGTMARSAQCILERLRDFPLPEAPSTDVPPTN